MGCGFGRFTGFYPAAKVFKALGIKPASAFQCSAPWLPMVTGST